MKPFRLKGGSTRCGHTTSSVLLLCDVLVESPQVPLGLEISLYQKVNRIGNGRRRMYPGRIAGAVGSASASLTHETHTTDVPA